jgi:hypothetical protein
MCFFSAAAGVPRSLSLQLRERSQAAALPLSHVSITLTRLPHNLLAEAGEGESAKVCAVS